MRKPKRGGESALVGEDSPTDDFLRRFTELAIADGEIHEQYYRDHPSVNRGLRRTEDGSGIRVECTRIGEVHGFELSEGKKKPVDGSLSYRGYDIRDLVKGSYEEICYLLLGGNLPTQQNLQDFSWELDNRRNLPEGLMDIIRHRKATDTMNGLISAVAANFDFQSKPREEETVVEKLMRQSRDLIARFGPMIAAIHHAKPGNESNADLLDCEPLPEIGAAANFLRLARGDDSYTSLEAKTLDEALILHADHGGGNNSTFAARTLMSARADLYAAISAAVGSLAAPRHGGANIKVEAMMRDCQETVQDLKDKDAISRYLEDVLNGAANDRSGLIYGMGHAVYTLSDPRAIILKKRAKKLAQEKGMEGEFDLYSTIEQIAPDVYRRHGANGGRVIAANVDFYSGLVLRMLKIPPELYTPVFALARIGGWTANAVEEVMNKGKLIRPAYLNVQKPRKYVPIRRRRS